MNKKWLHLNVMRGELNPTHVRMQSCSNSSSINSSILSSSSTSAAVQYVMNSPMANALVLNNENIDLKQEINRLSGDNEVLRRKLAAKSAECDKLKKESKEMKLQCEQYKMIMRQLNDTLIANTSSGGFGVHLGPKRVPNKGWMGFSLCRGFCWAHFRMCLLLSEAFVEKCFVDLSVVLFGCKSILCLFLDDQLFIIAFWHLIGWFAVTWVLLSMYSEVWFSCWCVFVEFPLFTWCFL